MDRPSPIIIGIIILAILATGIFAIKMTVNKCSAPDKKILLVGTNPPFPPFEDLKGGEVVGFDMDIIEKVSKSINKKVVYKVFTDFGSVLPALKSGNIDIVASSVTMRSDREEMFDFSDPYYIESQAALSHKTFISYVYNGKITGNTKLIAEDFKDLKVACQKSTTSQFWVRDNLIGKINLADTLYFDDMDYGLQLLRNKVVDVIIVNQSTAEKFVKLYPQLHIVGTIKTGEKYGFVVQKGDPKKLLPAINKTLKEIKSNGEYQKLVYKWFGGGI
jgi:polar amino acid transport system substrate-binding protein